MCFWACGKLVDSYPKVDAFKKHAYLGYLMILSPDFIMATALCVTHSYKKFTEQYHIIIYPINSSNFYNIEINYTLFSNKTFNSSPSNFAFDNFIPNVALGKGTILTTYPTGFFTFILS